MKIDNPCTMCNTAEVFIAKAIALLRVSPSQQTQPPGNTEKPLFPEWRELGYKICSGLHTITVV